MLATVEGDQLTTRQQEVLDYIGTFRKRQGYAPSFREMMANFGISSPNGIKCHLLALRKKGYIRWKAGRYQRTITVVGDDHKTCPHCGGKLEVSQ